MLPRPAKSPCPSLGLSPDIPEADGHTLLMSKQLREGRTGAYLAPTLERHPPDHPILPR